MFIQFLILIFGFILLIYGANALVNGSSNIAKKFNVPEILIGLTIVALWTSLPELVVTIVSAATNNTDIVVGNVIGSNICNLLLILGITGIIKPIKFEKSTIKQNLPLLIFITVLTLIMGLGIFSKTALTFTKIDGIILFLISLIYFSYPIVKYIREKQYSTESDVSGTDSYKNNSIIKNIIYILFGGIALKYGGDFVVNSATTIANMINIPERVIGLTIVSLGTSLPELITSIVAILKHNDDLAEGNIIGSCIINFCLILGIGATISNLPLSSVYIEDLFLLLASTVIIWLYGIGNKDNTLKRGNGLVLIIIYLIYLLRLFI